MKPYQVILFFLALLTASCLVLFMTGCESMPNKEERCGYYRAAYETYQAVCSKRKPSSDEIQYARIAAAFLQARCGWVEYRSKGESPLPGGVPVIVKPPSPLPRPARSPHPEIEP